MQGGFSRTSGNNFGEQLRESGARADSLEDQASTMNILIVMAVTGILFYIESSWAKLHMDSVSRQSPGVHCERRGLLLLSV